MPISDEPYLCVGCQDADADCLHDLSGRGIEVPACYACVNDHDDSTGVCVLMVIDNGIPEEVRVFQTRGLAVRAFVSACMDRDTDETLSEPELDDAVASGFWMNDSGESEIRLLTGVDVETA